MLNACTICLIALHVAHSCLDSGAAYGLHSIMGLETLLRHLVEPKVLEIAEDSMVVFLFVELSRYFL